MSDKKIKYLHLMTDSNYVTVNGFTALVNDNLNANEHFFIVRDTKDNPRQQIDKYDNVLWLPEAQGKDFPVLLGYLKKAEHIYWHSMGWYWKTQLKMLLRPSIMKKSTWVEWGADLFNWRRTDGNRIVRALVNLVHKLWRCNVESVVAIFPTDEAVYREQFSKKVPVMHAIYSVYHHSLIDEQKPEQLRNDGVTHILVGHSATPLCNHIDVLDSLAKFKDEAIMIHIPLTYGETEYAERVKARALELFSPEKVHFLTENMPLWDYVHFLWDIDVGIFKVYRQIALGNICRLLYMTKKVYLPSDSILYRYFTDADTEVYDCDKIAEMTFDDFAAKPEMTEPSAYIQERMTLEKVIAQWQRVFDSAN